MGAVFRNRDQIGSGDKIELLIHSPGGHPDIAYRVMKLFRRRFKEVNVIIPLWAKSAATLMCLGADKIFLGEFADLGPIDIQIDDNVEHGRKSFSPLDEFKSLEYLRDQAVEWMDVYATVMNELYGLSIKESLKDSVPLVSAIMRPVFEQIDPIEMGGNRRAIAIGEEYAKRMFDLVGNPKSDKIIRKIVWGYPAHDFCIDLEEAQDLGLPVEQLPPDQDRALTNAILEFREAYDGFVPSITPAVAAKKTRAVRKARGPGKRSDTKAGRPNGSGRGRTQERREGARTANGHSAPQVRRD
jgi:hypothetical protein